MSSKKEIFADDSLVPFVWAVGLVLLSVMLGWSAFELPGTDNAPMNLDQKFFMGGGAIICAGLSVFMFNLTLNKQPKFNIPMTSLAIAFVGVLIFGHGFFNLVQARIG